ncbi:MAG: DinB family protein [Chloroflexi bacterium]|nr:DinB family protein [Chloroflexota bacterium]
MATVLCDTLLFHFDMLRERTLASVGAMSREQLLWRPAGSDANPSGFLLWHMARREDFHLQTRIGGGAPQIWVAEGWHDKFGIDPEATGFGFTAEQVRDFPMPALQDIIAYYNAVRDRSIAYCSGVDDDALLAPLAVQPDTSVWHYLLARVRHEDEHWGQIDYLKGVASRE